MGSDLQRLSFPKLSNGGGIGDAEFVARKSLESAIDKRKASLSAAEAFFLRALLIDTADDEDEAREPTVYCGPENDKEELTRLLCMQNALRVLDDDVLFSVPEPLVKNRSNTDDSKAAKKVHHQRPSKTLGLWQAHEEGAMPRSLSKRGSLTFSATSLGKLRDSFYLEDLTEDKLQHEHGAKESRNDEAASDQKIRMSRSNSCDSAASSWDWDEESSQERFSTWEILKDEYAKDFGFDYTQDNQTVADVLNDTEGNSRPFKILGTSADDTSAQPHVLSPPLMDSLKSFLPSSVADGNYWLKFSLVRDGACLETLKQYCRGSKYTILAIETRKGDVFGAFATESWRNNCGCYGSGPAFVWKMRHSRNTKCSSLFDQAQLESEIDVYRIRQEDEEFAQLCRHDSLSVGGVSSSPSSVDFDDSLHKAIAAAEAEQTGFALTLEEDLLNGTTCPSPAFSSPSLCGRGGRTETFEVMNLEVWTFTPCMDVASAQKLEMSKFFIEESVRTASSSASLTQTGSAPTSPFSSREIFQEKFYRRLGQDPEGDERRQRWQSTANAPVERGLGVTPRFV